MRILAIDPGAKRHGLSISDPTAKIARPLEVLSHVSRTVDAARIVQIAAEHQAGKIIVGQSLDMDNKPTLEGRRAARLAAAIRAQAEIPVELWDEFGTTQAALRTHVQSGTPRKKREGHQDDFAAVQILQSYLDAQNLG